MIPDYFVQELLERVDIVDLVGKYVQLRKGGANLMGLCPFHNEKSPSFTVSPSKQFYHCFGCGASGDAIGFLMNHTGAPFHEAIKTLASSVGMIVPEEKMSARALKEKQQQQSKSKLHEAILEQANNYYQAQLKNSPEAIAYLKDRGLSGSTAKRFGIGWAEQGSVLRNVFSNYQTDELMLESGLVVEDASARRYDRFRERVMFPIRNTKGNLIGFGGRIIDKGEPKYLNSPETPLFNKGQELYGLWENRQGIHKASCVVVVEGYMDVVGLAQHGFNYAVATLGTATTSFHIQKLIRASNRIVFSFDGDKAGRKAAHKALLVCLPLLRDDVSLRFLFLPEQHDPDSYVRAEGLEKFESAVKESLALSQFYLQELSQEFNLSEAEGRAACVHENLALLNQIPTSTAAVLRTQLLAEFASLVKLTVEELNHMLEQNLAKTKAAKVVPRDATYGQTYTQNNPSFTGAPDYSINDYHDSASSWAPANQVLAKKARAKTDINIKHSLSSTMAKKLFILLMTYPQISKHISEHQLSILSFDAKFDLVRELASHIMLTHAGHTAALLNSLPVNSELAQMVSAFSREDKVIFQNINPLDEWMDALCFIEIENIDQECDHLIQEGLDSSEDIQHYRHLTLRKQLLRTRQEFQILSKEGNPKSDLEQELQQRMQNLIEQLKKMT